ncbi:MAG: ISKra4 family transposase [Caldimonas sp.]
MDVKVIVRAQLVTDWGEISEITVAEIERPAAAFDGSSLGLSLSDGKQVMHALQQAVASAQANEICGLHRVCQRCSRWNPVKDYRQRKVETVFGVVHLTSPRIVSCPCEPPWFLELPCSPLAALLRERATPELQLLQATLCAQMSYRRAAIILREFLPVGRTFNHVTLRNRKLRVGERLDSAPLRGATTPALWTLAIDGGFVRGVGKGEPKNFELLTGRLAAPGHKPYVFAWCGSQVGDIADRVATMVRARTRRRAPKLRVITDGANNTQSIPRGLPFPAQAVLDWFHISMRIRHLEQIAQGLRPTSETERMTRKVLQVEVSKLRWCFWHGNVEKAEQKLSQILLMCRIVVPQCPEFGRRLGHLDYRAREFFAYTMSNKSTLFAYGRQYRKGEYISSAMAESAVNQVINARMCKRQQMRWTPRGAHLLAQVRCAVLNGDAAARLRAYEAANVESPSPEVGRFIVALQKAAA